MILNETKRNEMQGQLEFGESTTTTTTMGKFVNVKRQHEGRKFGICCNCSQSSSNLSEARHSKLVLIPTNCISRA